MNIDGAKLDLSRDFNWLAAAWAQSNTGTDRMDRNDWETERGEVKRASRRLASMIEVTRVSEHGLLLVHDHDLSYINVLVVRLSTACHWPICRTFNA